MSDTSGVDDQTLSLPRGGGAVQGLGATFDADLNTGTGNFAVPIPVPAGPNGIRPAIQLRYQTGAGNGPFGVGWTLGQMAVARKTDGRIPDYGLDDDLFTLVGDEDLIPMGGRRYRSRVDTLHWRIIRQGDGPSDGWELTDTRGTVHRLGQAGQSRVESSEGGSTRTALWYLDEMRDSAENAVAFTYQSDGPQRYLQRIEWGTYRLEFTYEERQDRLTGGRYGFLLPTNLRCSRIELHVTNIVPTLARSWSLAYAQTPGSMLSLLQSVTLRGHAEDGSSIAAPVLIMRYTEGQPRELLRMQGPTPGARPGAFADGRTELIDWDGDGLPDALELGPGQARLWPNIGRGRWGTPRSFPAFPAPIQFDEPGVAFADMDGNGTADLVLLDRPLGGYYPHQPGGGFGRLVRWPQAPAAQLGGGLARLVDLDGDGATDLLVTGDQYFSLYFRDAEQGWSARPTTLPRPQVPPVSFRDTHTYLADMNGDGLQDLVRVDGGGVTYWPYLGHGRWADPVRMADPPSLPRDFDPRRLYLSDVDGDGCADLVYVDLGRVIYWLNQGGLRTGSPREIPYTPPGVPAQIRLADMNGNGTEGVLWSSVASGSRLAHFYLDLTGGVKPYLLAGIDNGAGVETTITYRPSTEFAIDAAAEGKPWRTFHPFPVHCVAEVRIREGITGQECTTRYRYHEARYDGEARVFLGFGEVDVDTIGDESIPTLRMHNVYHLGLDPSDPGRRLTDEERLRLGALRRRLLRTESYALDGSPQEGRPFQVVIHDFDTRVEAGANGRSVVVPFEVRMRQEQWERGDAPFAFREVNYLDIDPQGNILRQRMRAWRVGEPKADQDVVTEASFAANSAAHIVSLPARITQRDASGAVLSANVKHYDGLAHVGLPEGQALVGHLTRHDTLAFTDELVFEVYGGAPPDFAALGYHRRPGETGWWVTKASFERRDDPAGLALIVRGPRGFETRLDYDATRQYPRRLTDAAGNVVTGENDLRALQMASVTDANGQRTFERFDALGRVVAVVPPGDTDALPGEVSTYQSDVLPVRRTTSRRQRLGEAASLDSVEFFDGHGQPLQQVGPGEGDLGRKFIISGARELTARGQVRTNYLPFYSDTSEYAPPDPRRPKTSVVYDGLGRVVGQISTSGAEVAKVFAPGRVDIFNKASGTGAVQRRVVQRVDALQRVIAVECAPEGNPAGPVVRTTHAYNALNLLVGTQDPDGGVSQMTYDLLGRLIAEQGPDVGRTVYVLDAASNIRRRSNGGGAAVVYAMDVLDRLTEIRQEGAATADTAYTYLDAGSPIPPDGVRNRRARLYRIRDRLGTLVHAYDERGRLVQQVRSVDALAGRSFATDIAFDDLGRQTRMLLPEAQPGAGRRVVQYAFNARGLPVTSPGIVRATEYDVLGRATRTVYQNGVENLAEYNPATGRTSRLRVIGPGGVVHRDQTLRFDDAGNLVEIGSPIAVEAGIFAYDDLDRLTGASYGSGETFRYRYSDGGNITHIDGVGDLTYGTPGSGAVKAAGPDGYAYTPDGHLRTAPYGTLTFDGLDNLTRIDLADGRTVEYAYDFGGQRVLKRVSGAAAGPAQVVYATPHLEINDGTAILWITFGAQRILALVGAGGAFVHADIQGGITLYTDLAGGLLRRVALGPYGTLRFDSAAGGAAPGGPADAVRFAGQPVDTESGLICLGRRFYDPRLGRFISPDRIVPGVYVLDAWNRYTYAHNNPLRFNDPTGSKADTLTLIATGLLVGLSLVLMVFGVGAIILGALAITLPADELLTATAIGIVSNSIMGGLSADKAGGDVLAGMIVGGLIGGATAYAGGALGTAVFLGLGSKTLGAYVLAGAISGAIVGGGTGAAIGFAGGKAGGPGDFWGHVLRGMAWGAISGAALGLLTERVIGDKVTWKLFTVSKLDFPGHEFLDNTDQLGALTFVDPISAANASSPGGGVFSFFPEFQEMTNNPASSWLLSDGAVFNIPIGWVPTFLMKQGGIGGAVTLSIGLDNFGVFSYSDQILMGLGAIPIVGWAPNLLDVYGGKSWESVKNSEYGTLSMNDAPGAAS